MITFGFPVSTVITAPGEIKQEVGRHSMLVSGGFRAGKSPIPCPYCHEPLWMALTGGIARIVGKQSRPEADILLIEKPDHSTIALHCQPCDMDFSVPEGVSINDFSHLL